MRPVKIVVLLFSLVAVSAPAVAGTPANPEVTDPAGDANVVDGAAPGTTVSSPASVPWADLTKVWFTTDFSSVPAKRDGQRGMLKVPQRLRVHIQTAAPIAPVGAGTVYAVEWEVNNCTYRLLAHVPGALRDSRKALLGARCPGAYFLDLQPPVVNGNELQIAIDLGSDLDLHLYDGYSLARIRAFTAPYVDWYWDYRYTTDTQGYIDHAPSAGALGYYEIGSDLEPRFTPGLAFEPGTVKTVAGGTNGDGLPATQASLADPWSVSVGPDGLVYISDYSHSRIRRVAADGTMEPFAGFVWGFGGDGRHRLLSLLNRPAGMDWGGDGTLYFADSVNHRIRAIAPDGTIRTVAGDGARRFAGDGGPATKASLAWPQDVAVAPNGDLYVADLENARIRKVDMKTGVIATYAGGGPAGQDNVPAAQTTVAPYGLAFDGEGDLWVSEVTRVREIDRASTVITPRLTGLGWGRGIVFDGQGRLYVADSGNHQVLRRSADGTTEVFAGGGSGDPGDGGSATDAVLDMPTDVAVDEASGRVYISERTAIGNYSTKEVGHDRVRVVRPDGTIDTLAGTGHDKAIYDD
ncbi:MAG TPA: hypothetical protein VEA19_02555, partial [Actinomycetota bacterium]|nr:hypothetical protein [Actinomycetota bacterium]